MSLGFRLQPSFRLLQLCRYCTGSLDDHESGCPMLILEQARGAQQFLECPVCKKDAVDVNAYDHYECRQCKTQFSRAAHHEGAGERVIIVSKEGRALPVIVLPQKGKGDFPTDKAVLRAIHVRRHAKPKMRRG